MIRKTFFYPLWLLFFYGASLMGQSTQGCDGIRYYYDIFTDISKTTVQYGQNLDVNGDNQNLMMDIYQPEGDTIAQRPVMIFAFGGYFIGGQREDMEDACLRFARKGYVAATIDYRLLSLTGGVPDSLDFLDIVAKASHDMKAAIRYFRQDAATDNLFKIDPNHIFVGGYSAGAITALHTAYLDEDDEIPGYAMEIIMENGGFEGTSGDSLNLTFSSSVQGVLNLSGALYKKEWISNNTTPLASYHGTADDVVPFMEGEVSLYGFNIAHVYGSGTIHQEAEADGIVNGLYAVEGGGHVDIYLDAEYEEDRIASYTQAALFFHEILCPGVPVGTDDLTSEKKIISVYPNPASQQMMVAVLNSQPVNVEIYNFLGQRVARYTHVSGEMMLDGKDFLPGMYLIRIMTGNKFLGQQKIIWQ